MVTDTGEILPLLAWLLLRTYLSFLADRTIGRAFGTLCRLSVCRLSSVCLSVCNVLYCGETVRPSEKLSEGVNRKPGSKSSFLGSPPYFYFRFRRYGHQDGRFCLIFARIAQQSLLDGRNWLSSSKPCAYYRIVWSELKIETGSSFSYDYWPRKIAWRNGTS